MEVQVPVFSQLSKPSNAKTKAMKKAFLLVISHGFGKLDKELFLELVACF